MNRVRRLFLLHLLLLPLLTTPALAELFKHVVLIVQENRTPDNLFQGLCVNQSSCSVQPSATQYNIQTGPWQNKNADGGFTAPVPIALARGAYDPGHSHSSFVAMCDRVPATGPCKMDGAGDETCIGTCPVNFAFAYVDHSTHVLDPYLALARQYGWANDMFATNQGPSYPAHQFLFGATSAPSAADDQQGTFAAENGFGGYNDIGCATSGTEVQLIDANGNENTEIFPCFEHYTISDLLEQHNLTWRYYTPTANNIWAAPNSINHICVPVDLKCTGADWKANVDIHPPHVLTDIAHCRLRSMSWVIPSGQNSDHPRMNNGHGPSWVASIVNAIGNSTCKDGWKSYWDDTAIIIVWDDWGGWYDHVAPKFLAYPQGGYQYGFRVPCIVVSAYTPQGFISYNHQDFGSIARFIEYNFNIPQGILDFADARQGTDMLDFFNMKQAPRPFVTIPAPLDAAYFIHDKSPPLPPDTD
jgi:phospholipase C